MLWVCVIGAYMKRKSNLMLIAAEKDSMSVAELFLAYSETASYLEKAGVSCSLCKMPEMELPSGVLLYAYDELEKVIESKLPAIERVDINIIEKENSVLFDINVDATPLKFEFGKEGKV